MGNKVKKNIVEKLNSREQEVQSEIKVLKIKDRENTLSSLISRIELAIMFVTAKKEFKKRFYTVVNEDIASKNLL